MNDRSSENLYGLKAKKNWKFSINGSKLHCNLDHTGDSFIPPLNPPTSPPTPLHPYPPTSNEWKQEKKSFHSSSPRCIKVSASPSTFRGQMTVEKKSWSWLPPPHTPYLVNGECVSTQQCVIFPSHFHPPISSRIAIWQQTQNEWGHPHLIALNTSSDHKKIWSCLRFLRRVWWGGNPEKKHFVSSSLDLLCWPFFLVTATIKVSFFSLLFLSETT